MIKKLYYTIGLFAAFLAAGCSESLEETFCNSGKFLFVPYTKGFGRITHFLGNDLATVLYTAFFLDLLFK